MSGNIYQWDIKFIHKSKKVHNNKYNYDEVRYVDAKTKVTIICPVHGAFKQTPDKHSRGKGCPTCGGTKKLSNDEFITKAKNKHGNRYNYTLTDYHGSLKKVQITCTIHGIFKQTPKDHLNGCGCPLCGGHRPLTQEIFEKRSNTKHENKYDYSLSEYVTGKTKVIIKCPTHGKFDQTPSAHMRGNGCPKCHKFGGYSETVFNNNIILKQKTGRLYLLQFTDKDTKVQFLKIGITQTSIEKRYKYGYTAYQYETLIDRELNLYDAFCLEQQILTMFESVRFEPKKSFGGFSECFTLQHKTDIIKTIDSA